MREETKDQLTGFLLIVALLVLIWGLASFIEGELLLRWHKYGHWEKTISGTRIERVCEVCGHVDREWIGYP